MLKETTEVDRPKKPTVSLRKIEANRKNALKSTGPKTPRGKTHSRGNAMKHGLFSRQSGDFMSHGEDPAEYDEIWNGLRAEHQPIGVTEELLVESLAVCWWKLKRAWRYENATNRVAIRDIARGELDYQADYCKTHDLQEAEVIRLLQEAAEKINANGEISAELKQRISATEPMFDTIWNAFDLFVQERLSEPKISKLFGQLSSEEKSRTIAKYKLTRITALLEQMSPTRHEAVHEIALAQHVVPNADVLDKILRYEAATNRQIARIHDQLERLQRRRRGEMTPPTLRVQLG